MIELGDKIRFVPSAFSNCNDGSQMHQYGGCPTEVTGVIDYINQEHRWYRVRFEIFNTVLHEGFKF